MRYIEPHAHMVSRTTDDYQAMITAGCAAVCEPSFWAGFDRTSVQGFYDYFLQLTQYEPNRAKKFQLPHYSWLCINAKEAEDIKLAEEVISIIPEFIEADNVLGIGEIGLNRNTKNELTVFEMQVDFACKHNQMILIHTPHLEDKKKGTKLILDVLENHSQVDPSKVIIDHVEEHTIQMVKDLGYWAGVTLYPDSKCSKARAVDLLEVNGLDNIWLNCACDWGVSDPLAVPKTAIEMKHRGHNDETIDRIIFKNPNQFLSQNPKFKL